MGFGKVIPEWLWPTERRKGKRRESVPLQAFYWEAAAPQPHAVRDISPTGMYLVTDDRWYVNTLITMTLARTDLPDDGPKRSVRVMTRVVRSGKDGVAVAFVWPGRREEAEAGLTDQRTLKEFVEALVPSYVRKLATGIGRVVRSCHPPLISAGPFVTDAVRPI